MDGRNKPGHDAEIVVSELIKTPLLPDVFTRWFTTRGWQPRAHQLALLEKARAGKSSLLIAPTGGGKTLAGFLPTLVELYQASQRVPARPRTQTAPSPLVGEGWGGGWPSKWGPLRER